MGCFAPFDGLFCYGQVVELDRRSQIREDSNARLDEAAFEERVIGIEKATAALKEAKVEDEKIIYLLQKYWDLRLSEAKEFLQQERYTEEK